MNSLNLISIPHDDICTLCFLPKSWYEPKKIINPTTPFKTAHSITELFILCGKNHVNCRLEASGKRILAVSTNGMKVTQAIVALNKKVNQKIFCLPKFVGAVYVEQLFLIQKRNSN